MDKILFPDQLVLLIVVGVPLLFGLSTVLGFWKGKTKKIVWILDKLMIRGKMDQSSLCKSQECSNCRTGNHFRIIRRVALLLHYGIINTYYGILDCNPTSSLDKKKGQNTRSTIVLFDIKPKFWFVYQFRMLMLGSWSLESSDLTKHFTPKVVQRLCHTVFLNFHELHFKVQAHRED